MVFSYFYSNHLHVLIHFKNNVLIYFRGISELLNKPDVKIVDVVDTAESAPSIM